MASKTTKNILYITVLIIAVAGIIGYKMYNKQHFSVSSATPAAEVTAIALHQTFTADSAIAKSKFTGDETNHKVIKVEGEIAAINEDQQNNTLVLLKTATEGAFINCTMEGKITNINAGTKVFIKGVCTGYNFDADMGIPGDVILTRCLIAD
jgi:tRNA_anti-like